MKNNWVKVYTWIVSLVKNKLLKLFAQFHIHLK